MTGRAVAALRASATMTAVILAVTGRAATALRVSVTMTRRAVAALGVSQTMTRRAVAALWISVTIDREGSRGPQGHAKEFGTATAADDGRAVGFAAAAYGYRSAHFASRTLIRPATPSMRELSPELSMG